MTAWFARTATLLLFAFPIFLSSLLLLLSLMLHGLLLLHRQHPVIKASSLSFSHLLVFGSMLGYLSGGVHVLSSAHAPSSSTAAAAAADANDNGWNMNAILHQMLLKL